MNWVKVACRAGHGNTLLRGWVGEGRLFSKGLSTPINKTSSSDIYIWHWPKISNIYPCYLGIFLGQNISISTWKCTKLSGNCPFFTYLGLVSYKYFDKYVKKYFLGSHIRYQNMPKCWKCWKFEIYSTSVTFLTNNFCWYTKLLHTLWKSYPRASQHFYKTQELCMLVKSTKLFP